MTTPFLTPLVRERLGEIDGHATRITQDIPDDFLTELKERKEDSRRNMAKDEMHQLFEIPWNVSFYLKNEHGLDPLTAPARDTVKLLKRLNLDHFVTTAKRL